MKVLFVISSLESGGKERQCVELIKGLCEKGVVCELVLLKDEVAFQDIYETCCRLYVLDKKIYSKYKIFSMLRKIVLDSQADFIQSWDTQSSVYAALVSRFSRIVFINYSIQYAKKVKFLSKHGLSASLSFIFSKVIIANSQAGLNTHLGVSKGICIKNGYDSARLSTLRTRDEVSEELSLNYDLIIGMVGNFLHAKDHNTLILAVERLLAKGHSLGVILIGNGPTLSTVQQLIQPEYLHNFLFLQGKTQVEEYINLFDIHCLICNTNGHAEGISNAIMEGMAVAKPVIATNSGGNKELVLDGKTGYIIDAFDTDQLEEKLELLLKNEALRLKLGAAGKERISTDFSKDLFINSFLKLYRELK